MQEFNILKSLTANTTMINSDLTIFNNYYLNDEIFDNKLVNKFNVRNFLIDSKNNSLVSNFTSFTHNKLSLLQIDYIY